METDKGRFVFELWVNKEGTWILEDVQVFDVSKGCPKNPEDGIWQKTEKVTNPYLLDALYVLFSPHLPVADRLKHIGILQEGAPSIGQSKPLAPTEPYAHECTTCEVTEPPQAAEWYNAVD